MWHDGCWSGCHSIPKLPVLSRQTDRKTNVATLEKAGKEKDAKKKKFGDQHHTWAILWDKNAIEPIFFLCIFAHVITLCI